MNIRKTPVAIVAVLLLVITGCDQKTGYQQYGASVLDSAELTSIRTILDDPSAHDGQQVTVKGIIAAVCPSSGCFLRLGEGASQIFVDLQESGFTVPPGKNLGHLAFVSGVVRSGKDEVKIAGTGVRIMEK